MLSSVALAVSLAVLPGVQIVMLLATVVVLRSWWRRWPYRGLQLGPCFGVRGSKLERPAKLCGLNP